jgi:cystathionine beta-lyase/cystathionine gamma-synthase
MNIKDRKLDTKLIHAGEPNPRIQGSVAMPVFLSSTFEYSADGTAGHDAVRYARLSNTPNHVALHEKLAALENAEAALVTGSGMAAISAALLGVLRAGDRLIAQRCLYGGTHGLVTRDLAELGIGVDFVDASDPSTFAAALHPTTRAFYVETLTNPLLELADLPAVAAFSRANELVSIIDNTFASPVNFRPVEHGFDLVVHSCTKYLNGHSDLIAGAVLGKAELVAAATRKQNNFGGCLNPDTCALLHRGMKTMALRVRAQNQSAFALAHALVAHPAVAGVNYPGLESHPAHTRARTLLDGFGGMLSFELAGGLDAAERFLAALTIPIVAPSLGGVETLVIRPATSSHLGMGEAERKKLGIAEGLVRVSVGIEATSDLIEDFEQALDRAS